MALYRIAGPLLALALLVLPPGSAPAGFEDGYAAWMRSDYATAFRELMPLAIGGDPRAQSLIAGMHHYGNGTPQDYAEAARWYRLAAAQGDALAQAQLGWMYANGKGVPQDYAEAARWWRLAADQGDVLAQRGLGSMYSNGNGVPQDYAEAHAGLAGPPTRATRSLRLNSA